MRRSFPNLPRPSLAFDRTRYRRRHNPIFRVPIQCRGQSKIQGCPAFAHNGSYCGRARRTRSRTQADSRREERFERPRGGFQLARSRCETKRAAKQLITKCGVRLRVWEEENNNSCVESLPCPKALIRDSAKRKCDSGSAAHKSRSCDLQKRRAREAHRDAGLHARGCG